MRINNKDEALDLLFSEARKEKSPLNQTETVNLLQGKNNFRYKRFFNQKTILMMSSFFVTSAFLVYFLNPFTINNQSITFSLEKNEKIVNDYSPIKQNATDLISNEEKTENLYKRELKKSQASNNAPSNKVESRKENIQEITPMADKLIELPEEVLAKMYITFTSDGICFGNRNDIFMCYNYGGTNLSVSDEFNKNREEIKKRISPVLITDAQGKHWRSTTFNEQMDKEFKSQYADSNSNSELYSNYLKDNFDMVYPDLQNQRNELYSKHLREFINNQVNSFIPILVRLPEKYKNNLELTGTNWGHDLILWYQPTEAFLAMLPDTLRTKIIQENPSLAKINIVTEKPNPGININLSLYPNPVIDKATINYQLEKDKKVNIALHDISGKLVKVFVRNEIRNGGNNTLEIDLKDLIQGVYILSIETADGNILTQRVIKQ